MVKKCQQKRPAANDRPLYILSNGHINSSALCLTNDATTRNCLLADSCRKNSIIFMRNNFFWLDISATDTVFVKSA